MVDDDSIDFSKLEKEFHAAKKADQKYSRENDAKFRAVNQKVASYEEFRDIVTASHLTPLERDDIMGTTKVQQPWNRLYNNPNSSVDNGNFDATVKSDTAPDQIVTRDAFLKAWKVQQNDRRLNFLLQFDSDFFYSVFECDIPFNFLETTIEAILKEFPSSDGGDLPKIVALLFSFTRSKRFGLTLKFLGHKDKVQLKQLFTGLKDGGCDTKELEQLYNV